MRINERRPNKYATPEQLAAMREATEAVFKDHRSCEIAKAIGVKMSAITAARCRGRFSVDLCRKIAKLIRVKPWTLRPDLTKADFIE